MAQKPTRQPAAQPQPPPTAPPAAPPTDFQGANAAVLRGDYLQQGNPYQQAGLLDPIRRQAQETYDQQRAALDEAALQGGGAAYGGDMYQNLAARMYGRHQQQVGEQQNAVLANQYNLERQNQMQALSNQQGWETSGLDRDATERIASAQNATSVNIAQIGADAQLSAARISAQTQANAQRSADDARIEAAKINAALQRDLQGGQLDFNRQQLALDAMNSLSRNNLAEASFLASLASQQYAQDMGMTNLAAGIGGQWGQQQLAGFGMVPGMEQAGYIGGQAAMGAEGQVNQADAAAEAHRARIEAQNAQARWEYDRYNGQGAYDAYMRNLLAMSQVGGTSDVHGTQPGTPAPPPTSPWLAGLGGALGTYAAFGGGQGGGGGGAGMQ